MNALPLNVVIIEKTGNLKNLSIKNFKIEELYKKCGFKNNSNFAKIHEWKLSSSNHILSLYGKIESKKSSSSSSSNSFKFPDIDNNISGNCIVIYSSDNYQNFFNLDANLLTQLFNDIDVTKEEEEESDDDNNSVSVCETQTNKVYDTSEYEFDTLELDFEEYEQ